MPYNRPYNTTAKDRRRRGPPKRTNATQKVVKSTKYRKSAKAQAVQIRTVARATTHIQRQLKDNQNTDIMWTMKWSNRKLATRDIAVLGNCPIIPLTSGPTGNSPSNGATSNLPFINPADPSERDCAWVATQPKGRSVQDGRGAPPFARLFRQNIKVALHSNTLTSQVRYTAVLIRLARKEDGSHLDNTMLQRDQQINGASGLGHPSVASDWAEGEDFYAIQGFLNPQGQTNTSIQGVTDTEGHLMVRMNYNRWKVLARRDFVLGPARGNNIPQTTQTSQSHTQVGATLPNNTSFFSFEMNVNYGGAKVAPSNIDATGTATDPMTLNDLAFVDLNPRLKHYLVFFPSKSVRDVDPAPPLYQQGCPVISVNSTISSKVPT